MIDYEFRDLFLKSTTDKQYIISAEDGSVTITNAELHQQGIEITESICTDENLKFGGCEASSIKFKISNIDMPLKNKWFNVSVMVDKKMPAFPLGRFKVVSDKLSSDRRYKEVSAYDLMYDIVNAEISKWYNGLTFPMKAVDFRNRLFEYLGIEQVEVSLPNDEAIIYATPFFDNLLAGEVLKDICEINGCFGQVNRQGKFDYVFLGEEASYEVNRNYYQSSDLTYEDFSTSEIDGFILAQSNAEADFYYNADGENLYYLETRALFFGENKEIVTEILNRLLTTIGQVKYVPCSIKCVGNPCVVCGDKVKIHTKDGEIETYVLERSLSGAKVLKDSLEAEGEASYEKRQSGAQRVISNINNQISDIYRNNFYSYTFTNALEYSIAEKETNIIDFNVSATTNTSVILIATIPIVLDRDGALKLKYYEDAKPLENNEIVQYLHKGKNFVTISNYFDMGENDRIKLSVSASISYVESEERKQQAKIVSLENYAKTGVYEESEIDITPATGKIEQWGIKATLFAKGIAGTSTWDGTINVFDEVPVITIDKEHITILQTVDSAFGETQIPEPAVATESVSKIYLQEEFIFIGISDSANAEVTEGE